MIRIVSAALVHIYTASGAFLAFLAALHVVDRRFSTAFLLLMIAMIVDYSDGTLARLVGIRKAMPLVDGSTLDHIVDFATSAFVPAFILWRADLLPPPHLLWVMIIFVATLYKFSKTYNPWITHGFFTGVPTPWITLSFYFFFYRPRQEVAVLFILVAALLTFLPVRFIHIARFRRWRIANILGLSAWWAIYLVITQGWIHDWRFWLNLSVLYPLFYGIASWYFGKRHARGLDLPHNLGQSSGSPDQ